MENQRRRHKTCEEICSRPLFHFLSVAHLKVLHGNSRHCWSWRIQLLGWRGRRRHYATRLIIWLPLLLLKTYFHLNSAGSGCSFSWLKVSRAEGIQLMKCQRWRHPNGIAVCTNIMYISLYFTIRMSWLIWLLFVYTLSTWVNYVNSTFFFVFQWVFVRGQSFVYCPFPLCCLFLMN